MPLVLPRNLPRYDCLLKEAERFPDLDPSACEAYLHLLRAGHEALHGCEAYFTRHNLSQGRFTVLMLLFKKQDDHPAPLTPAELADLSNVKRATMTGLIDTLERDGLVIREPDPKDRRMMSVKLTPRARTLLQRVLPGHFRRMAALMKPLSESERKKLVRLLNKIATQPPAPSAAAS